MSIPTRDETLKHNRRALLLKAVLFAGLFLVVMAFTSLGSRIQNALPIDGLWPAISAFIGFAFVCLGPLLILLALAGFIRMRRPEDPDGA